MFVTPCVIHTVPLFVSLSNTYYYYSREYMSKRNTRARGRAAGQARARSPFTAAHSQDALRSSDKWIQDGVESKAR